MVMLLATRVQGFLTTLIYEMKGRNVKYRVASACIDGGQGIVLVRTAWKINSYQPWLRSQRGF